MSSSKTCLRSRYFKARLNLFARPFLFTSLGIISFFGFYLSGFANSHQSVATKLVEANNPQVNPTLIGSDKKAKLSHGLYQPYPLGIMLLNSTNSSKAEILYAQQTAPQPSGYTWGVTPRNYNNSQATPNNPGYGYQPSQNNPGYSNPGMGNQNYLQTPNTGSYSNPGMGNQNYLQTPNTGSYSNPGMGNQNYLQTPNTGSYTNPGMGNQNYLQTPNTGSYANPGMGNQNYLQTPNPGGYANPGMGNQNYLQTPNPGGYNPNQLQTLPQYNNF